MSELRPILDYLREAEALARALEDPYRQGWASLHICHLLLLVGECTQALELGRAALGAARLLGDGTLEVVANHWLGCAHYALGNHREAVDSLGRSVAAEARFVQAAFPAIAIGVDARGYLSMFLSELGEFARGDAVGQEALRIAGAATDHPWSLMLVYWKVGELRCVKGELDLAISLFQRAEAIAKEWGFRTGHVTAALGYALALSGRAAEGVELTQENMKRNDAIGYTWLRGRRLAFLGEAHLLAGRPDAAEAVAQSALKWCRQRMERGFEGWSLRLLGEIALHRTPCDVEKAEDSYRQALTLAAELEMLPLVAHCHLGLGKLYRRTGKREQAHEHLATATTMYREMDMRFWLEQAEEERRELA